MILGVDLETYSDIDLAKAGLYKYAENSEILLFAFAYGDEPVQVVDMACGEELPEQVLRDLTDPDVQKTAFNAAFEMHVLGHWLGQRLDPAQWYCTMVQSYTLGLPGHLKDVGKVLGLPEDRQKLAYGKRLIQYFCKPCRPTKANGGRTRNRPADAPDKWELFKTYNARDVETERAIRKKVFRFNPTPTERKLWCLDRKINDAGVLLDETLVDQAITLDARIKKETLEKAIALTGMENPNSNTQLLDWFERQEGWRPETLDKKARAELLMRDDLMPETKQMLRYKQLLSKTSVKKYVAMKTAECRDGRDHGMLQFCGAARTGRWCLTGDHEVLAPKGWTRIDQWQGGEIACWNTSGVISFSRAKKLEFPYDGPMITVNTKRCEQISTPDHRMPYRKKDGCWSAITVKELLRKKPDIPFHKIAFNGTVYCAETKTGFFLVRRNGKVWVTGNSGRIVQLQNLPQNHLEDLDDAREFVKAGDLDSLEVFYDNPSDVLSQLIRTAFVAGEGKRFIVSDFAAIEARVIAWLANEEWEMRAFAEGKDIYCATASAMFGVPVVKHGINGDLRQKGKIATLACIAKGQKVLTNHGLKPIEQITLNDKVWDGGEFVKHDGLIFKGYREVMTYEGLTATPDHLVYIQGKSRPVRFEEAATRGAHLVQAGNGWHPLRACRNNIPGKTLEQEVESLLCTNTMRRLRFNPMAGPGKPKKWQVKRMPILLTTKTNTVMAKQEIDSRQATLRKPQERGISELWGSRNPIQVQECYGSRPIPYAPLSRVESEITNRPNRQQWRLCSGQYQTGNKPTKQPEQADNGPTALGPQNVALQLQRSRSKATVRINQERNYSGCGKSCFREKEKLTWNRRKTPVYDILNAGPRHRFTVSGKLVHNCGYGGGVNALKAFGADKMGLSEQHMQDIVTKWRQSSPHIVRMWADVERAVKSAIRHKGDRIKYTHGLEFYTRAGLLFIKLPSGRAIAYAKPGIELETKFNNREAIIYEGTLMNGGWGRCFTWGGKLVENIVQATARDCLAVAMLRLDAAGYKIVMHVHDEVILEMPYGQGSLEEAAGIMGEPIPWAPGLLLRADGYETPYYKKD